MTSLSFPSNPTNGQQYTDLNGKVWTFDGVKWNISTTQSSRQFTGVKVSLASDLQLVTNETAVSFDTEEFDVGNFFNVSTPTQIVIPRTGYYRVNLVVQTGTEGDGTSYVVRLDRSGVDLFSSELAANQSGKYDNNLLLNYGETITLYASETNSVGSLVAGTILEIQLIGYTFGGAITPGFEFSGVNAILLSGDVSTTSTPAAITWASGDINYNINANAAGNVYWSNLNPTRFTISTTGYYKLQANVLTGTDGSDDSYVIDLRKNGGTTVESGSLGPLDTLELDETYYFTSTDYLELYVSNTDSVGSISSTDTTFTVTRLGV